MSESCQLTSEFIRGALNDALEKLLVDDYDLIALGAHEQSIAHRVAVYLEPHFPSFHTDCEYNRRKHLSKRYRKEEGEVPSGMRPDIIVHRRNDAHENVLAVEMKANANSDNSGDMKKLKALQTPDVGYGYREVAFVRILNGLDDIDDGLLAATITWFGDVHQPGHEITIENQEHRAQVAEIVRMRISEKKKPTQP